jgi:hypothetical protein
LWAERAATSCMPTISPHRSPIRFAVSELATAFTIAFPKTLANVSGRYGSILVPPRKSACLKLTCEREPVTSPADRARQCGDVNGALTYERPLGAGIGSAGAGEAGVSVRARVSFTTTRAGLPMTTEKGGTSLMTTLFDPTMAPSPTVTPFMM